MAIFSLPRGVIIVLSLLAITTSTAPAPAPEDQTSKPQFFLPDHDPLIKERLVEVRQRTAGYQYGPSLIGKTSFFPTGPLGDPMVARDIAQWQNASIPQTNNVNSEIPLVLQAVTAAGGLTDITKYHLLQENQWKKSNPTGVAPGTFTNYTQDLFFSMERLSTNPFAVRRLHPTKDVLPYHIDDAVVEQILNYPGHTLAQLHAAGRLFIVDHSYQKAYREKFAIAGRFSAACTAYFYMHPDPAKKDVFLPLSIKTNVGADLVYTPLDTPNEWLLAKLAFNGNDLFHGQIYHLASSHAVAEIVHQAALRKLSARHPVLGYLDRLMYQAYAIRPIGNKILFNPGGFYDQVFPYNSSAVHSFAETFYPASAGKFVSNYLTNNAADRGLVDASPELPSFPFYEDASAMVATIKKFFTTFVYEIYKSERDIFLDDEVQNWMVEAVEQALVIDFAEPYPFTREILVEVLTHMAYLTGINHHSLNSGTPCATSGTLPFHPAALYKALPTVKGVDPGNLVAWLPDLGESMKQIALLTRFNRPNVRDEDGGGALIDMFDDKKLLAQFGTRQRKVIKGASDKFRTEMAKISKKIKARKFDGAGLSQGMPFIWSGLDPEEIPFYLSV